MLPPYACYTTTQPLVVRGCWFCNLVLHVLPVTTAVHGCVGFCTHARFTRLHVYTHLHTHCSLRFGCTLHAPAPHIRLRTCLRHTRYYPPARGSYLHGYTCTHTHPCLVGSRFTICRCLVCCRWVTRLRHAWFAVRGSGCRAGYAHAVTHYLAWFLVGLPPTRLPPLLLLHFVVWFVAYTCARLVGSPAFWLPRTQDYHLHYVRLPSRFFCRAPRFAATTTCVAYAPHCTRTFMQLLLHHLRSLRLPFLPPHTFCGYHLPAFVRVLCCAHLRLRLHCRLRYARVCWLGLTVYTRIYLSWFAYAHCGYTHYALWLRIAFYWFRLPTLPYRVLLPGLVCSRGYYLPHVWLPHLRRSCTCICGYCVAHTATVWITHAYTYVTAVAAHTFTVYTHIGYCGSAPRFGFVPADTFAGLRGSRLSVPHACHTVAHYVLCRTRSRLRGCCTHHLLHFAYTAVTVTIPAVLYSITAALRVWILHARTLLPGWLPGSVLVPGLPPHYTHGSHYHPLPLLRLRSAPFCRFAHTHAVVDAHCHVARLRRFTTPTWLPRLLPLCHPVLPGLVGLLPLQFHHAWFCH